MALRLSLIVQWGVLLIVRISAETFPSHCLDRHTADPTLSSSSCESVIGQFSHEYLASVVQFRTQIESSNTTVPLPWDQVFNDCRLRIELIYAEQSQASVSDVLAAGKKLNNDCVGDTQYLGGRIFLNEQGLTLSLRPSVDVDWEERFNESSVVAGSVTDAGTGVRLYTITGSAGGTS